MSLNCKVKLNIRQMIEMKHQNLHFDTVLVDLYTLVQLPVMVLIHIKTHT